MKSISNNLTYYISIYVLKAAVGLTSDSYIQQKLLNIKYFKTSNKGFKLGNDMSTSAMESKYSNDAAVNPK